MTPTMDAFDHKILELMQRNCRLASDLIAEQVGLSPSAVQRRIKRLREEGVIQAEVAIVDPAVTTHAMTFLAGLEIDRDNYAVLSKFRRWAKQQSHIQQVFYVTGSVDLMLVITAPTPKPTMLYGRDHGALPADTPRNHECGTGYAEEKSLCADRLNRTWSER